MKVIITRSEEESKGFKELLDTRNISSFVFPCIEYCEPSDDYKELDEYIRKNHEFDWIFFLSKKAADVFFTRLLDLGGHFFHLHPGLKIACVGDKTADFIREQVGFPVDFVPTMYNSEAMVREFQQNYLDNHLPGIHKQRILIPRQENIIDNLQSDLEKSGQLEVQYANAYKVTNPELDNEKYLALKHLLDSDELVYLCFASSNTVENFKNKIDLNNIALAPNVKIVSIGPKTTETAKKYFADFEIMESEKSTFQSMLECVLI